MKNRIWKQIKQITVAAAVAGTVLFGSVQPGMAADSELQSGQELSDDREKEDGYEHMEELASGETVCKENEAPEEESESTQERTETGGENVESAALPLEGVEEEDMDMEKDMSEDTEDAEGNAGRRTGGNFAFCGCRHRTSRYDTFSDFRDGRNESREDHPLPCGPC